MTETRGAFPNQISVNKQQQQHLDTSPQRVKRLFSHKMKSSRISSSRPHKESFPNFYGSPHVVDALHSLTLQRHSFFVPLSLSRSQSINHLCVARAPFRREVPHLSFKEANEYVIISGFDLGTALKKLRKTRRGILPKCICTYSDRCIQDRTVHHHLLLDKQRIATDDDVLSRRVIKIPPSGKEREGLLTLL